MNVRPLVHPAISLSLYPMYLGGKADRALGRPAVATAEFGKIVDHLAVASNEPTVAVAARLELARGLCGGGLGEVKGRVAIETIFKSIAQVNGRWIYICLQ